MLLALFLIACNNQTKISQIKIGMKTTSVQKILGKPTEKMDNIFGKYYCYGEDIIAFDNDTVINITTKKEFRDKILNTK